MNHLSPEQRRLQSCSIAGDLRISTYEGDDGLVVTLYGDPDGLRSLAAILKDLAALDQQHVPSKNLPVGEGFHLHLIESRGLASESLKLDLGRSDPRLNQ
jgi:hypothetical protein